MLFFIIIIFSGLLSISAYLYGKRIESRLEFAGTADAYGSNEFALLLAAIIPLLLPFLKSGKLYEKLTSLAFAPFLINAFILCNSRGSTLAFALGIAISLILIADKEIRKKVFLLSFLAIPAFIYLSDEAFIERITTLTGTTQAIEDESEINKLSSGRTEIWSYGIEMAKDNPLGVGPDGFKRLAHLYMPDEILRFKPGSDKGVRSAHNSYLQVFVEQGFAGLFIWLIMCLHTLIILYKSFKLTTENPDQLEFWKYAVFSQTIGFISVLVGGMVNSRIYFEYFWWQIAFATVTYYLISSSLNTERAQKTD
jgi:O-antigen ligase